MFSTDLSVISIPVFVCSELVMFSLGQGQLFQFDKKKSEGEIAYFGDYIVDILLTSAP